MRNLRIGTKLTVSFGAVALFLVGVAAFAVLSLSNVDALTTKIVDDRIPKMNMASEMGATVFALRDAEADHIMAHDPAVMTAAETAMTARKAVVEKDYATLDPKVKKPRTRKALDDFKAAWDSYTDSEQQLIQLSRAERSDEAAALHPDPPPRN